MNVTDLPNCRECPLQKVPINCTTLFNILNNCRTVKIARNVKQSPRKKKLCPSTRNYHIRRKAYFLSLQHTNWSQLDCWLHAEYIIDTNTNE